MVLKPAKREDRPVSDIFADKGTALFQQPKIICSVK